MSPEGHLRRNHVDAMSAIAPIATELLREDNGRKGPNADTVNVRSDNLRQRAQRGNHREN
jgi:hypothetical protein